MKKDQLDQPSTLEHIHVDKKLFKVCWSAGNMKMTQYVLAETEEQLFDRYGLKSNLRIEDIGFLYELGSDKKAKGPETGDLVDFASEDTVCTVPFGVTDASPVGEDLIGEDLIGEGPFWVSHQTITGGTGGVTLTQTGQTGQIVITDAIGTTIMWQPMSTPELVETIVLEDSVELVYTQHPTVHYGGYSQPKNTCFKIKYSCVDGKWNKSEPIIGTVLEATKKSYEFD